jgi:succinate dehydrogenase / fumarate reductase membrane anchor subunit
MSFKTEYKRVAGLGSARDGTGHWISQRLTAIALMFLGPAFLIPFIRALGQSHETVLATYAHPFHALIAIGFFIVGFRHLRLGLQEVIMDYVHGERSLMISLILNALIWRGMAIAGAFAVAKIALGA